LSQIVDVETRQVVGPDVDGEMLIKSPCILTGYWNKDKATLDSFDADGWFKTGE
jgi:malonyl-CoA/methylmalonyl-CoA synthetase